MSRKEMGMTEFVGELFGVVTKGEAEFIYKNVSHYGDMKKNVIIDLLRANPEKYTKVFLCEDI